jgi:hypothetical protein
MQAPPELQAYRASAPGSGPAHPRRIIDEGARIRGYKEQVTDYEFYSRGYKDDREWLSLSFFAEIMARAGRTCPEYAAKLQPPEPDFLTYLDPATPHRRVEIAEVLRPERRRQEDAEAIDTGREPPIQWVDPPHPTPWRSFADVLRKKLAKNYARGSWLVIYHNMWSFDFRDRRQWHELVLRETRSWRSDSPDTCDLTRSTYEHIFVIDGSGTGLLRLHPDWDVIHEQVC